MVGDRVFKGIVEINECCPELVVLGPEVPCTRQEIIINVRMLVKK